MARKVRDANLDNRSARTRLKAGRKPHYRLMEKGLHIGYRRPVSGGAGRWVARYYRGDGRYEVQAIDGVADDFADADGVSVLNFGQAQERARRLASRPAVTGAITTVADAIAYYFKSRHTYDAEQRANALILPTLGEVGIRELTTEKIRDWHHHLAKQSPRVRGRPGEAPQYRKTAHDGEAKRRRRSSANRTLTVLKAALNHCWRDGKIISNDAWQRVKPFKSVDAARVRYLQKDEARRLVNAAEPEFRLLVQAALLTGARYGELTRLRVEDFHVDSDTIGVRESKSGKPRHIVLNSEGAQFFRTTTAGRSGGELLFTHAGAAWGKSYQVRPMRAACIAAGIKPAISFHGLRHTYASLAIMNGAPPMVVARNLGHADTRMVERHYGHLSESWLAIEIKAKVPELGIVKTANVARLGNKR
ncbi:MAG: tyrosine-type recombinase/integrase [Bacteroidota bacterium]